MNLIILDINRKVNIVTFSCRFRLQELSTSNEESPDLSDIELIQHINVDTSRLIKLLNGIYGAK